MGDKLVFVPCRLDRRDARSALIEDADGWPRKVVSPLGRVAGRLVVAARWLREAGGRHRVRFGDGTEMWVVQGPGRPEGFVPLGWEAARRGGNDQTNANLPPAAPGPDAMAGPAGPPTTSRPDPLPVDRLVLVPLADEHSDVRVLLDERGRPLTDSAVERPRGLGAADAAG